MNRETSAGNSAKCFVDWLIGLKTATLWHPESPGCKVTVTRSRFGRMLKPTAFATLGEAMKDGIIWRSVNAPEHRQSEGRTPSGDSGGCPEGEA